MTRAGPGGFASDVDDVGTFFDQALRLLDGFVAIKERAAIRERIRRDVDHAHDERAFPQLQDAGANTPVKD